MAGQVAAHGVGTLAHAGTVVDRAHALVESAGAIADDAAQLVTRAGAATDDPGAVGAALSGEIVGLRSRLGQVEAGVAQLHADSAYSAPGSGAMAGVEVLREGLGPRQQLALADTVVAYADHGSIVHPVSADPYLQRQVAEELASSLVPGLPLDSVRVIGHPVAFVHEPVLQGTKVVDTRLRAVGDNLPVGEPGGYATLDQALAAARGVSSRDGGIVAVRSLAVEAGNGAAPERFTLHRTPGAVAPVKVPRTFGFTRTIRPELEVADPRLRAIVSGTTAPEVTLVDQMRPASDAAARARDASVVPAARLRHGLGDASGDVDAALDAARTGLARAEGAREQVATRHRVLGTLREHLDTSPGTGDPLSWERAELFPRHQGRVRAGDEVGTVGSADELVHLADDPATPDGMYAALADADGRLHLMRLSDTETLPRYIEHDDVRAVLAKDDGAVSHVTSFDAPMAGRSRKTPRHMAITPERLMDQLDGTSSGHATSVDRSKGLPPIPRNATLAEVEALAAAHRRRTASRLEVLVTGRESESGVPFVVAAPNGPYHHPYFDKLAARDLKTWS